MRAFRLAYDGRPYHGFQRQPDVPTVEGVLQSAFETLDVLEPADDVPPGYAAAGRTDAGVSAVAQTVAFECPAWCRPRALNGALPGTVRAWASADVDPGFHATHDAIRREYVYFRPAPDADLARAREAAERLSGEHDFHNLTADDHGTVRDLSVSTALEAEFLMISVAADGFPRQLVRRLAALVGEIADGNAPPDRVERVLLAPPVDGPEAVPPAPAEGLVLSAVVYPDVVFEVDEVALTSARAAFDDQRRKARTTVRTTEEILDGLGDP